MISINQSAQIDAASVSEGWCKLYLKTFAALDTQLGPTMIRILAGDEHGLCEECPAVRKELDSILMTANKPNTNETASIIFPHRVWKNNNWDIEQLSDWYLGSFLPRLKATAPSRFRRTYFERMIDYFSLGQENPDHRGNQLKFVIDRCKDATAKGTHFRQSGLQIAVFDPARDHSREPYLLFPCLQQIGFHFPSNETLGLTAYYPTQKLVERAYGNYLGLCQLGEFVADSLGLRFTEFGCFIGSPRLGWPKGPLAQLSELSVGHLARLEEQRTCDI
jgi:hypothetical protein